MMTENYKALQIGVQLLPSPCHINFINQEHGVKIQHPMSSLQVEVFMKYVSMQWLKYRGKRYLVYCNPKFLDLDNLKRSLLGYF